jgi:uncharacterized protein with beta-barrel porin domain
VLYGAVGEPLDDAGAADADAAALAPDVTARLPVDSGRSPIWLKSFDQGVSVADNPQAPGYIQRAKGLVAGVDFALGRSARAGGAIGHVRSDVEFGAAGGGAHIDSWQANVYGLTGWGRFYANAQAGYGRHGVSMVRVLDLPETLGDASARGRTDALAWSASSEIGAVWREGRVGLQPLLALAYRGTRSDGFSDVEPGAGHAKAASNSDSVASTLGFRATRSWRWTGGDIATEFKLGWRHEFGDEAQSFAAHFGEGLSPASAMTLASSAIASDSLLLSTGAKMALGRDTVAFVSVNGRYSGDDDATNAAAGVRVVW